MSMNYTENEIIYLKAWAIEDHKGRSTDHARTLQRENDVRSAVLGALYARYALATKQCQMDMVEKPYPEGVVWPWASKEAFELRLKELLPEISIKFLEEIGALTLEKAYS